MRAFIAVEPDAAVHARLAALKHELEGLATGVRWVRDDALHITLKFLGSVTPDTLAALHDAPGVRHAAAPPAALFAGLGVFPDARRPRVLWAGVRCPALTTLARAIDEAAAALGIAPAPHPLVPHVTLGRLTDRRAWRQLEPAVSARAETPIGRCAFPALIAFGSDLRPGGAVYTKLWSIPFGA